MIGQKQAVVNTLLSVLKDRDVDYVLNGEENLKDVLTKDDKTKVNSILCAGFIAQEIQMSAEASAKYLKDPQKLKTYVSGLINNWVRKNTEFNNGVTYAPKMPGSRTGQRDETIKNLRLMKKEMTDPKVLVEIDQAIADRLAEIKPESVVTINPDAIPEHLRHLLGKSVKGGETTSDLE